MVKEDIETVIDKLYDLIKAGNKITVKEAALALSLTEEQVEKLAIILEESDLIEIQYTLAGSVLMPKKAEMPNTSLIPVAKTVKSNEVLDDVKSVENVAEFIEKDFIERLSKAEKSLGSAGSKDLTKKEIQEIRKELQFLQERLKNFQSNVKKIEAGEVNFEQQLSRYQTQLAELEKTGKVESGGKQNPTAFLAHFLAFLIAWLQTLSKRQPKTAAIAQQKQEKTREVPKQESKPAHPHDVLPSLKKMKLHKHIQKTKKTSKPKAKPKAKKRNKK